MQASPSTLETSLLFNGQVDEEVDVINTISNNRRLGSYYSDKGVEPYQRVLMKLAGSSFLFYETNPQVSHFVTSKIITDAK